jgi:hypothetical protein
LTSEAGVAEISPKVALHCSRFKDDGYEHLKRLGVQRKGKELLEDPSMADLWIVRNDFGAIATTATRKKPNCNLVFA